MLFSKEVFGQRLRAIRKASNDAQPTLAKLIGVSIPQISDMENGKKTTTLEKLALICQHYKVSADYLLGLIDTPNP